MNLIDSPFFSQAKELFPYSQAMRRDIHRHPELGFQEFRTAGVIARELHQLGLEVTTGVAKTGVVAILEGDQPGPTILVRFDIDGLPVSEETGAEYASQEPGRMHACGHDGHVAVGLTVARLLSNLKADLAGKVKFIFQPAEEGLGGAEVMVKEGVLQNPRPKYCLALHIWNERPVGWLGFTAGPVMAAADFFWVKIDGKGGHGASPQQTIDPVMAAVQWISAVQTIVSRNVPPLETAVVSVTSVKAGETFNVIPPAAEIQGTIRTFEPEIRKLIVDRFQTLLHGICTSMGCTAQVEFKAFTPPVTNDVGVTKKLQELVSLNSPESQLDTTYQTMISEDMAFIMQEIPGCYFLVGGANPDKGLIYSHHHPKFDFDEEALIRGSALMAASVMRLLKE